MAIFEFDLQYRNATWKAECTWRDGERGMYGFDRRLNLTGEGKSPEEAVENLIKISEALLSETSKRIREDFAKFDACPAKGEAT